MTISFILNGDDVSVGIRSGDRLADVLRGYFGLLGVAVDCRRGVCGRCLVFLDGSLVPSCLLPAFKARGREVVTIEGFSQTDEYNDVTQGFSLAGVETCGFCETGKILVASALLDHSSRPSEEEILTAMASVSCRCTDPDLLVKGVQMACELRAGRLYHRARQ
jgi:aerobic carbon-monoxide dehydrogenase small subunit